MASLKKVSKNRRGRRDSKKAKARIKKVEKRLSKLAKQEDVIVVS